MLPIPKSGVGCLTIRTALDTLAATSHITPHKSIKDLNDPQLFSTASLPAASTWGLFQAKRCT